MSRTTVSNDAFETLNVLNAPFRTSTDHTTFALPVKRTGRNAHEPAGLIDSGAKWAPLR